MEYHRDWEREGWNTIGIVRGKDGIPSGLGEGRMEYHRDCEREGWNTIGIGRGKDGIPSGL